MFISIDIQQFLALIYLHIVYFQAVWSDKFVFNVYAHSVFPCERDGVQVVFEYPGCILSSGDRVRLFARLRPDVAALAPPTSLHYVAEQKVDRGRHKLFFDCSLFSEKFVEYCFVYVSQAVTGALSDVRMDCVPTLPVLGKIPLIISQFKCFSIGELFY